MMLFSSRELLHPPKDLGQPREATGDQQGHKKPGKHGLEQKPGRQVLSAGAVLQRGKAAAKKRPEQSDAELSARQSWQRPSPALKPDPPWARAIGGDPDGHIPSW